MENFTNKLLGYPNDARLLLLNCDDFGYCNSINRAVLQTLHSGPIRSASLMMPCPWAVQALHFLQQNPQFHFGIHLTLICDGDEYTYGPMAPKEQVPLLLDCDGTFYNMFEFPEIESPELLKQVEIELRAQIEAVLTTGLKPDHLDWHSLRVNKRPAIYALMLALAREYALPLRVMGQEMIAKVQSLGLPGNDRDFLDSWMLPPADKAEAFVRMLHDLPAGLSEWAIHPGFDCPELFDIEPTGQGFRQADLDFWASAQAKEVIEQEGIIVLDYAALLPLWEASALHT